MYAYVPSLYFELSWPYRRPKWPYRSPSGAITLPGPGQDTPCYVDREVFLFLVQKSRMASRVEVPVNDVSSWLGANRRQGVTRDHIRRVLSCELLLPRDGMYARHVVGSAKWLDSQHFVVDFDPLIVEEAHQGTPFLVEHAAALRCRPAALDLFLCMLQRAELLSEYAEFTHEIDPREFLPHASDQHKARQNIVRRLDTIQDMLEVHLSPSAVGPGVLLDFDVPKRAIHLGTSPVDHQQRRQRAHDHRAMPPEERRMLARMMRLLGAWEARLDQPDPWLDVNRAIELAAEQTAGILDKVEMLFK